MPLNYPLSKVTVIHQWDSPFPLVICERDSGGITNRFPISPDVAVTLFEELNTWVASQELEKRAEREEKDGLINIEHSADVEAFYLANHGKGEGD